jgi:hypothetical protein
MEYQKPGIAKKNAFVLTRDPTDKELLAGITRPKSHFGKACDRRVKELRLAGITFYK